jgi:hypothetical protein
VNSQAGGPVLDHHTGCTWLLLTRLHELKASPACVIKLARSLLWQEAFWKLQAWRETISKQMPSIPVLCCVVKPESICWLLLTVPCAITYSFSNLVRAPQWGGRGPEKAGLPSVSGL